MTPDKRFKSVSTKDNVEALENKAPPTATSDPQLSMAVFETTILM